ncbi:MAG: hypothetical protein NXY57DRAFT_905126 [Lentinula lateritia]|nr:MAG: hypothetical protein NXY57DRAFT_905126 [Lentinula lateritia]
MVSTIEPKSRFRRLVCSVAQKFHSHHHNGRSGRSESVAGSANSTVTALRGELHTVNFSIINSLFILFLKPGKVALITGSSKSTGASIARALAAQGASVVINYAKDSRSAEEVAQQINLSLNSTSAIAVKADSSTISGGHYLLQETLRVFRRLDILVLNAGLMGSRTLSEIDESFFDAHFDFNVKAPLFLVKEAAEVMVRPGGRIIFLSTSLTTASTLLPNALCYVASKGAVEQVARVLSKDLGTQGFTVNTVALGPVDTALFRAGTSQHVISSIAAQVPSHRIAEPDDIAPVVAFLASPAAQWVNGQIIGVNGVSHNLPYTIE